MELTVNQIKERQKNLKRELREKLNQFEKETGLKVTGKIKWGYTDNNLRHWLDLKFSNPFMSE